MQKYWLFSSRNIYLRKCQKAWWKNKVKTTSKQTQNEVGRFFYNLAEFVFEYFFNSRKFLASFAKFCLKSLFATWSYRYPNPKHVIQRALTLPSLSPHGFFDEKGFTKSFPSSHLLSRNLAKTLQVLVYDNFASVRRSADFELVRKATNQGGVCRDLSCQKRMCGRGKGERARAGWRVWALGNGTIMLRKANWDRTLQNSLKFSDCWKSIRKQIRPSCRKTLRPHFVFVWFHERNEI